MHHRKLYYGSIMALILFTTGCSILNRAVYRVDINQGNYLDPKSLKQLKVGLTKEQVLFLLGTPMINDPFTSHNTWFYLSRQQLAHQSPVQKTLKLNFDNHNRLLTIQHDFPLDQPATATLKGKQ